MLRKAQRGVTELDVGGPALYPFPNGLAGLMIQSSFSPLFTVSHQKKVKKNKNKVTGSC